jgi:regulator of sigma E protease
MDFLADISHYGFWFVVVLTVLVFVHEMGHFAVARLCGVRVETFSIGFGPELLGFTDRRGTRWKLSWLPFGGYVKMFGQEDNIIEGEAAKPLTDAERAVSFREKSVGRRAAIVVAGPAANYVFAIVVLAILYATLGRPYSPPVIHALVENSAAAEAGLLPGDRIVEINGTRIDHFEDIQDIMQLNLDQPLVMVVQRGEQRLPLQVKPRIVEEKDIFGDMQRVGRIGIQGDRPSELTKLGIGEAVTGSVQEVYRISAGILTGVKQMVTGMRSTEELGGVLRIAKMSGDVAQFGFISLVNLAILLSINLGLINLFPVPLLDGGHLVFYAAEALRGKPLNVRAQEWGLKLGLALVLSLMLFATWNDLVYLKVFDYIRALFT